MKFPKVNIAECLLILSVIGLAVLAVSVALTRLEPDKLRWEAIAVLNTPVRGEPLVVLAETVRRDAEGCTNGIQAEMRNGTIPTRLTAPTRTMIDKGLSRYEVALPSDILPGSYSVRLRETFNCHGRVRSIDAPWVRFEVKP